MLLPGLLPVAFSASFFIYTRTTHPVVALCPVTWALPFNYQSGGGVFSVEAPSSMTLTYVKFS